MTNLSDLSLLEQGLALQAAAIGKRYLRPGELLVLFNGVERVARPAMGINAMDKGQCYEVDIDGRGMLVGVHELEVVRS